MWDEWNAALELCSAEERKTKMNMLRNYSRAKEQPSKQQRRNRAAASSRLQQHSQHESSNDDCSQTELLDSKDDIDINFHDTTTRITMTTAATTQQ